MSAHSHGHSHAHAINYENIGQTLCRRTRIQGSLRRVLCHRPLVLNLKYLSQYFRYTLPKLYFVCSPSSARLFPSLRYSNSAGTGDRHGHTHTLAHMLTPIVPYLLCVFLSCVEFGLVWQPHGRFTCSSNCYGCHIFCFCGAFSCPPSFTQCFSLIPCKLTVL